MSTTQPTTSTTIAFTADSGGKDGGPGQISMGLDDAKNAEVYGQNKSNFVPGETAYLYILPHDNSYRLQSSAGVAGKQASILPYPKTENLTFADSNAATLGYPPMGPVQYKWLGQDGGKPLFTGQAVKLPRPAVGVLQVEYLTAGDRIRLDVTTDIMVGLEELPVLVMATNPAGKTGDTTVTYTSDGEGPAVPVPVDINVKDFCSEASVPGATVHVNGIAIGVTNANGLAYAGMLVPGRTYSLRITAEGYEDSDIDVISNDSFTVSKGTT